MTFWKSLSGSVVVEFTSAAPEEELDLITKAGIPLSNVIRKRELTCRMTIRRKDYRVLSEILQKRGSHLDILRRNGLYWNLKAFLQRPVLCLTAILLFVSSFWLPSRIFFISVDGNTAVPDRRILSAAEACGIRFGASRKTVRSEKVKNALLASLPQLQWAGVNTAGCTAVISVRERAEEEPVSFDKTVSNLVANRDGYILSATVTNGTGHCAPGDTVTKGQLLVSGYTDCGICIRITRAEGEILAQTSRNLCAVMPVACSIPEVIGKPRYQISLLIGKKRINLWKDSRISGTSCGRMYEEYFVSLPGGFQLPIGISTDCYREYRLHPGEIPEASAKAHLHTFSRDYLTGQMIAGEIIGKQQRFSCFSGLYQLDGSYVCREMIGQEQREQIGVINGKRS